MDFGALVTFHELAGWALRPALALGYLLGGTTHYVLTRYWVFSPADRYSEVGRVGRYMLLAACTAATTLVVVPFLARHGLDYRLAKVLVTSALVAFNYWAMPRFVMR